MRRIIFSLVLCAALLGAAPSAAQDERLPEAEQTIVTFTMQSDVEPAAGDVAPRLRVALMERLGEQNALSERTVESRGQALAEMHARFVFDGLDAFRP
jgi:hypothetical protein